jgi:N-acetyl sugar amidotransferase
MDTTDSHITFDDEGICHHCSSLKSRQDALGSLEERGRVLSGLVRQIQKYGKGKKYDCVIGISGGVDSTFVALKCRELGLRPLAVHFDNGWNSELSVMNIENTVKKLDIDLQTHVMDWEQFRDLQVAFLKSSTPDTEAPTDHGLRACLYDAALKHGIKHILVGTNVFTEGILPKEWSYGNGDWKYIQHIHRRFGDGSPLNSYPRYTMLKLAYIVGVKRIQRISILNYLDYNKNAALKEMKEKLDYREYAGKHYESIFTRFFQGYILPEKFNYDKRRAHYSVLIVSGQLMRDEALEKLEGPTYDPQLKEEDKEFVIKKLELSEADWKAIMDAPRKSSDDYPNSEWVFRMLIPYFHKIKRYT